MRKKYLLPALMFLMVMAGCGGGGSSTAVLSSAKAITAFSLDGVSGTIDETGKTIAVFMPLGTTVTALVATFTTTGSSVKVGSTLQVSGTTANNFTGAVVYTVTAADGTTQNYTVTVTVSTTNSGFPDKGFGTNGIVKTDIGGDYDYGTALAIQSSDGKIVVAGYSYNGINYDFAVVRYNKADGSLDTTFGPDGNGKVTTPIGNGDDAARAVGIQSDGKIVVAGYYINTSGNSNFVLVRYETNGSLDATFGTGGIVTTQVGDYSSVAYALVIDESSSDRKIVVAGYSGHGTKNDFAVVKYNTNGSLDTTFGGDGKVTTAIGSGYDIAYTLGIQLDGKIIVAGYSYNGSNNNFAAVRYETNGSLDATFGTGGIVTTQVGDYSSVAYALVIDESLPDRKIVVAGYSFNGSKNVFAVVRYNTYGAPDTTFGGDGIVTTAIGNNFAAASALAIQSNGKIVAAGVSYDGSNSDFALVRYNNADGSLDNDFYAGGIVTTSIGSGLDVAAAVRVQSGDGKIVVAGYTYNGSNYDFALIRYWP